MDPLRRQGLSGISRFPSVCEHLLKPGHGFGPLAVGAACACTRSKVPAQNCIQGACLDPLAWTLQSGNAMQGTVHPELHAATPLCPTGSHLPFCALTRKADADGCVSIVAVLDLATLAGAVIAIAPTSFVAILALDVEARPGHTVSESMAKRTTRKFWRPVPPLHWTVAVRPWSRPKGLENAFLIHAFISNISRAEQLPGTVPHACEVVLHAIRFGVSDAHANLLEGNRVEGAIFRISFLCHWRVYVEQIRIGPQRGREAKLVCLADLQHQLPAGHVLRPESTHSLRRFII